MPAAQHERDLAGQHDVPGVRDAEQAAGEQPLHGSGGAGAADRTVGVRHLADGRTPGEPVEHGARAVRRPGQQVLDDVGAAEVLSQPRERGVGITGGRQAEVLEQLREP